MPPKRKDYDGKEEQTFSQKRRKEKRTAARTIAVQSTRAVQTGKDGKPSSSEYMPFRYKGIVSQSCHPGMEGLPASIDVEKFANV